MAGEPAHASKHGGFLLLLPAFRPSSSIPGFVQSLLQPAQTPGFSLFSLRTIKFSDESLLDL